MSPNFSNRHIAVLGFGVEGKDATDFLLKRGARVHVFDQRERAAFSNHEIAQREKTGAVFSFGPFPSLQHFDLIVRSPGIRPDVPPLQQARSRGVPITSVTNMFFELCPGTIVGVTGTKGKGTTASLLYHMLKADGQDAYLGGNIGRPMLALLDKLNASSIVVLELSSFQLMDATASPQIAIVLMVTKEHLDYHAHEEEYVTAKSSLVRFQRADDYLIVNSDYDNAKKIAARSKAHRLYVSTQRAVQAGCFVENDEIIVALNGQRTALMKTHEVFLPGRHNLENACAAVMAAKVLSCSDASIVNTLKTFKGLEHRLEFVAEVKGVKYYNDSYSTTPESAIAAIRAFAQPLILILGGSPKGSDFTGLGKVISTASNVKAIIGIGKEWKMIQRTIAANVKLIENKQTMPEIVSAAHQLATAGDVVVLSPACASFDMFKNYQDRGQQFKQQVQALDG